MTIKVTSPILLQLPQKSLLEQSFHCGVLSPRLSLLHCSRDSGLASAAELRSFATLLGCPQGAELRLSEGSQGRCPRAAEAGPSLALGGMAGGNRDGGGNRALLSQIRTSPYRGIQNFCSFSRNR